VVALVMVAGANHHEPTAHAQSSRPPNVLIILTDDQRAKGTMGVMDQTRSLFGEGGTKYRNGIATTPRCCPSRASIFTGKYVHNHDVRTNSDTPLLNTTETMQYQLKQAGYATGIVGKYLNAWRISPPHFDQWATYQRTGYYNAVFNYNGTIVDVPGYSTTYVGDKAADVLNNFESQDDGRPWFMQVSPFAPHGPAIPEDQYASSLISSWRDNPATAETNRRDKPDYIRSSYARKSKIMLFRERQLRALMSVDDMVASIFTELEALGEAGNTLAFFVSDNGFHWYEHRLAGKRLPYDDSLRVPFYVRWPGHVAAGASDRRIVANIDIAPTVYAAAGINPTYRPDGKNVFTSHRRRILTEGFSDSKKPHIPDWRSLWSPGAVYVRYPGLDARGTEYYTAADKWQLENVYRDGIRNNTPSNEAKLERLLNDYSSCRGAGCP